MIAKSYSVRLRMYTLLYYHISFYKSKNGQMRQAPAHPLSSRQVQWCRLLLRHTVRGAGIKRR